MSVFLIDYENLHTSAFGGLEELTAEDRVIVFYTSNSDNLTFSLMQRLNAAEARIEYFKVNCGGKNSLDFQLCSYLGYLMGSCRDTRFCIVSRDKGFLAVQSFWAERSENGNFVVCCSSVRNGRDRAPLAKAEIEAGIMDADEAAGQIQEPAAAPEEQAAQSAAPAAAELSETTPTEPPAEKPKRKYTRRTPYKRKPKPNTNAEQTA